MKLLMESWRGYLNEYQKDPTDLGKVPFAAQRSREERIALKKGGLRWTREIQANNAAIYEIIVGYVIHGRQPSWDDRKKVDTLKAILDSNKYPDILRWYDGKAYRGMLITDDWLDKWLSTDRWGAGRSEKKTQKKKKWMTRKHVFNLFKRFKKEITSNVNMFYNPNYSPTGRRQGALHGGKEDKTIESWSRSYEIAKNYALPDPGSLAHQQAGFQQGMARLLKRRRDSGSTSGGVLSIILESNDKNTFLDLEPLYKVLPELAPEAQIQEVPSISASIKVDKVHIPYGDFQKAYEFATKDWSWDETSTLPPYIKEEAERAGVILL